MTNSLEKAISDYSAAWWANPSLPTSICSPFGVWLLVAQLAGTPQGDELAEALGLPATEAREVADHLLANPHPALKSALAAWARQGVLNTSGAEFLAGLAPGVGRDAFPSQEEADAWTSEKTMGMIERFPMKVDSSDFILASALATDISWLNPYSLADATHLGGVFGRRVNQCLVGRRARIVDTAAAGRVAIHWAFSSTGVHVLNIIASDDIAPSDVHAAGLEVMASPDEHPGSLLTEQLPVGDFGFWSLRETEGFGDREEAYLPAWTAETAAASVDMAPGVSTALNIMGSMLVESGDGEAKQSAFAEYTAEGFRAAAVSVFGLRAAGIPQTRTVRELTVRFNHPYAVIAATTCSLPNPDRVWESIEIADPLWRGIPIFSSWVDTPMEAR